MHKCAIQEEPPSSRIFISYQERKNKVCGPVWWLLPSFLSRICTISSCFRFNSPEIWTCDTYLYDLHFVLCILLTVSFHLGTVIGLYDINRKFKKAVKSSSCSIARERTGPKSGQKRSKYDKFWRKAFSQSRKLLIRVSLWFWSLRLTSANRTNCLLDNIGELDSSTYSSFVIDGTSAVYR